MEEAWAKLTEVPEFQDQCDMNCDPDQFRDWIDGVPDERDFKWS